MKWRIVKNKNLYKVQYNHWFWTFGFWKDVKETRYIGADAPPLSFTLHFEDLNKAKDLLIAEYVYYRDIHTNGKKKKNPWNEVASLNYNAIKRDIYPSDQIMWRL